MDWIKIIVNAFQPVRKGRLFCNARAGSDIIYGRLVQEETEDICKCLFRLDADS